MTKNEKKIYDKAYRISHKAEIKAYRLAHPRDKDDQKASNRAYLLVNREKNKRVSKAYYLAHKEQVLANNERNRKKNRIINSEKYKARRDAYSRLYQQEHPEKSRYRSRKRRALKRKVTCEPYTDHYVFERDGWICQLCGQKINRRLKWPHPRSMSIDHIVPLSKGGNDAPSNIQAAHLRCNIGKHATNKGQLRLFR